MRKIIILFLLIVTSSPVRAAMTAGDAKALFDRIKGLEGAWEGKSTKGSFARMGH